MAHSKKQVGEQRIDRVKLSGIDILKKQKKIRSHTLTGSEP